MQHIQEKDHTSDIKRVHRNKKLRGLLSTIAIIFAYVDVNVYLERRNYARMGIL
jgi:hypothetical protein